jgi:hypothetical protein
VVVCTQFDTGSTGFFSLRGCFRCYICFHWCCITCLIVRSLFLYTDGWGFPRANGRNRGYSARGARYLALLPIMPKLHLWLRLCGAAECNNVPCELQPRTKTANISTQASQIAGQWDRL